MTTPSATEATPNNSAAKPAARRRFTSRHFSTVSFLIALILFLLSTPIVESLPNGDFLDSAFLTVVLVFGVLAVARNRVLLGTALILAAFAVSGRWLHQFRPDLPRECFVVPGLLFIILVMAILLYFILHAPRVDGEVLCAGLSVYLLLGMAWMFGYILVSEWTPTAFAITAGPDAGHVLDGFNAYYFSYTTLCTLGFGDIVPASHVARTLAAAEGVTGTLFMAVLIARLVALYSSQAPAQPIASSSATRKSDSTVGDDVRSL